jgi:2-iminobutanoate/2-iminopropanoate deaminase
LGPVTRRRTPISTDAAPAAVGPYSQAIEHGGLLYCSGQVPLDAAGELVGETPAEQATQCLRNLSAVAEAGGTSLDQALRLTVYTTRLEDFGAINEAYAEWFEAEPPARVTVGVGALPKGALVEIDAIVALPG